MFYHKLIPFSNQFIVNLIDSFGYYVVTTNVSGDTVYGYRSGDNYLYTRTGITGGLSVFTGGQAGTTVVSMHYSETGCLFVSQYGGAYKFNDGAWSTSSIGGAVNMCSDVAKNSDFAVLAHTVGASQYPRVQNPFGNASYPSTGLAPNCPSIATADDMPTIFSGGGDCSVLFANASGAPNYSLSVDNFLRFQNLTSISGIGANICCDQTPDGVYGLVAETSGHLFLTSNYLDGTWTQLDTDSLSWRYCEISDDGQYILACTSSNLFFSNDSGTTFTDVTTPEMTGLNMCTISGTGQRGYVACNSGLFMLTFY